MTYRLYWGKTTGAFAPEALLEELAVPYERVPIDWRNGGTRTPEFLRVNPLGQLPALALPDGTILCESAAILFFLAEQHPGGGLLPPMSDPARGLVFRWVIFGAVNLYEVELRQYLGERLAVSPECESALQAARAEAIDHCWGPIDQALHPGPYMLGDRFSLADLYLAMIAGWQYGGPKMATERPNVLRMVERVSRREKISPVWQNHYRHKPIFQRFPGG